MSNFNIMAIAVNHRTIKALELQEILTKYGCNIKMRLGLHEAESVCSEDGLVILQLTGNAEDIKSLEKSLNLVTGLKAKTIEISTEI